ncbi:MAG: HAD family hydrolase [Labrys sp. (in: a-proteobacteria)]
MHRPLTLVFDLDGTLVDSAPDLMGTLNSILADEGVAPLPLEKAHSLLGAGARALIERGLSTAGRTVTPERMEALFLTFLDRYEARIADATHAFDGVEDALATLADAGHVLAICTNKMERHSKLLLEALGLASRFSAICGRDTFPFFKPDARHLTLTVEAARGDLARTIMIGDSRTDIQTAKNAHVPSICVDFGYTDVPAIDLGADVVIGHFRDLIPAITAIDRGAA